jgi:hypothetical protein
MLMAEVKPLTLHVVVAFTKTEDDIIAEQPLQMTSANQAKSRARILMASHVGVLA